MLKLKEFITTMTLDVIDELNEMYHEAQYEAEQLLGINRGNDEERPN